jgi:hypothetical protein
MNLKLKAKLKTLKLPLFIACIFVLLTSAKPSSASFCSLENYKASPGLAAQTDAKSLVVTWDGEGNDEIRLRFTIASGTPTIQELSVRRKGGAWSLLGSAAIPEFRVDSGYRRLDQEALPALEQSVGKMTQQVLDRFKWDAFWDAPLHVPGGEMAHHGATPPPNGIPGTNQLGLPRSPDEVKRATARYQADSCEAKSDGQRLEITFPGVEMGIFSGRLQYTVYKGTDLLRLEVIAKTEQQSVAYKYDAGLKGLTVHPATKAVWRDTANMWQSDEFTGAINHSPAVVRAANRLLAIQSPGGSIATFPPPHNFFWIREISTNLGYNWYRKDTDSSSSLGIHQPEDEEDPAYAGRGPEDRRQNFALYNARPGTWQRMPVYFVIRPADGQAAIDGALAYTRNDHYKPMAGYWVMARHFHTSPVPRLLGTDGLDASLPDFELARSAGVNIFGPVGGGGLAPGGETAMGPDQNAPTRTPEAMAAARARGNDDSRLKEQELYYEMVRLQARKDFLVMPDEELFTGPIAGHNDVLVSHPVYWTNRRQIGQPFVEDNAKYGKVYHIGTPEDLMKMTHLEDMLVFMPHPNTKASAGYPRAFKDTDYFRDTNYRGIGFRWGMGIDRSELRLSDYRCMLLFDEMNNWVADQPTPPKYMDAITEVYQQGPGDDFYANNPVTYVRVEGQPSAENFRPVVDAMRKGEFFVTSGEVLIPSYSLQGTGGKRTITADVEWTFPLEFAEVVWGDGTTTDRQIIPLTSLRAFGKHHFQIPFEVANKKWVRFAVWDSAGNGAFVQPIKLTAVGTTATR